MSMLLDPNIIYFLFIGGLVLAVVAVFTPGTGIIELGAFFAIALAIYGFVNLPVNSWAITIMAIGFLLFLFSGKKEYRKWLIPGSYLLVFIGSLFVFRREADVVQINLFLVAFIDIIAISLLWLFVVKGIEAMRKKPNFDLNDLIGQETKALTDIDREGTVHVNGEDWTARSSQAIAMNDMVRVVGRNGLILIVEPTEGVDISVDRIS